MKQHRYIIFINETTHVITTCAQMLNTIQDHRGPPLPSTPLPFVLSRRPLPSPPGLASAECTDDRRTMGRLSGVPPPSRWRTPGPEHVGLAFRGGRRQRHGHPRDRARMVWSPCSRYNGIRGKILHTRNQNSEIPLENATEHLLDNSS